eukprot:m51a1_g5370 hypothetical protein (324) ;mRNA; f:528215-529339
MSADSSNTILFSGALYELRGPGGSERHWAAATTGRGTPLALGDSVLLLSLHAWGVVLQIFQLSPASPDAAPPLPAAPALPSVPSEPPAPLCLARAAVPRGPSAVEILQFHLESNDWAPLPAAQSAEVYMPLDDAMPLQGPQARALWGLRNAASDPESVTRYLRTLSDDITVVDVAPAEAATTIGGEALRRLRGAVATKAAVGAAQTAGLVTSDPTGVLVAARASWQVLQYTRGRQTAAATAANVAGTLGGALGGLGGAAAGAALGSAVLPVVGTVLGAFAGGFLAGWGAEAGARMLAQQAARMLDWTEGAAQPRSDADSSAPQ